MKDHLLHPRHLKSIAIWISVLMLTCGAADGQHEFKLTASDGAEADLFGSAVSANENYAIVGAPRIGHEVNGVPIDSGFVVIFRRTESGWVEEAKLTASDAAGGDSFGGAVSISGDYAIVGARYDDDAGNSSGSAYIFRRTQAGWIQDAKLTAGDAAELDFFGSSVSISGDYAIVGAPWADHDAGTNSGSASVFKRTETGWIEEAKLTAGDAAESDHFGKSVSISGDYAIVGAPWAGFASVFRRTESGWVEEAKLTASDAARGDSFGGAVSISGDYAIVGDRYDDDVGNSSGSAYIFRRTQAGWIQEAKLTASDAAERDNFGDAVSISGDYAIIGAESDDDAGINSGSAYLFRRTQTVWIQDAKLTASDGAALDDFGSAVSITDNYAMVGAPRNDDAGYESGSVYVYVTRPETPAIPMDASACGGGTGSWEMLAGETFENEYPGAWQVRHDTGIDAEWGTTSRRAKLGSKSAWGVGAGSQSGVSSGLYPNNTDTWMVLGPLDLRNSLDARFIFDRWVDMESGDILEWGASKDGVNFTMVETSGVQTEWKRDGYSMARPESQKLLGESAVWIAFRFLSDGSGQREGPFVDNICIQRLPEGSSVTRAPQLANPVDGAVDARANPDIRWFEVSGATAYELQVADNGGFANPVISAQTSVPRYEPAAGTLAKGTEYFWRVRGKNSTSTGPWSEVWSFTTEADPVTAPSIPLLSSPGIDASSQSTTLMLRWHTSTNIDAYRVEIADADDFNALFQADTTGESEFEFIAPYVSTDYHWRVRAIGPGGASGWSESRRFTTGSEGPLVPTALAPDDSASGVSTDAPLAWSSAVDAETYHLQMADDAGFETAASGKVGSIIVDRQGLTDTTHTVTGLHSDRTYHWRVAGVDDEGRSTFGSVRRFTTVSAPAEAVTLITPAEGSAGEPAFTVFTWKAAEGADRYHLQVDLDARFTVPVADDSTIVDTTYVLTASLSYSTQYFWRVRGINEYGSGPWSDILAFTTAVGTAAERESTIPTSYALRANYPNPFNPTTTIHIDLPETAVT